MIKCSVAMNLFHLRRPPPPSPLRQLPTNLSDSKLTLTAFEIFVTTCRTFSDKPLSSTPNHSSTTHSTSSHSSEKHVVVVIVVEQNGVLFLGREMSELVDGGLGFVNEPVKGLTGLVVDESMQSFVDAHIVGRSFYFWTSQCVAVQLPLSPYLLPSPALTTSFLHAPLRKLFSFVIGGTLGFDSLEDPDSNASFNTSHTFFLLNLAIQFLHYNARKTRIGKKMSH
ncbi:hypothetical protein VNO78_16080 [Psophocarpus tetragonolobus]|uniref:Uncharacterized protein n=1 Tax=Psophocarpus tetragonolobus TaxID=3891 RepID=A0AAN9SFN5_PSOTE